MAGSLRDISFTNKTRDFDLYFNLPEKQERFRTTKPIGLKHADVDMVNVFTRRLNSFLYGDEEEI